MRHALLTLLLAATPLVAAELSIQVTDETGARIWTRIEARDSGGKMHQPSGAILDEPITRKVRGGEPWYRGSFVVEGRATLDLPPGDYTVVAEHGLEYDRFERRISLPDSGATVEIQLKPWIRMRERGWYSADLHVHRLLEQLEALVLAEDVNLSIATTMWNKRSFWEERPPPDDHTLRASPHHLVTIMNAEDERGGGAWMLYGLPGVFDLTAEGRWYAPGIRFVERARAAKSRGDIFPWFEIEKPIWWETPVMMALAPPDSIGLVHNHFNQYSVMDDEAWGSPRDTTQYPGRAGFAEYCLQLYYRYLNLGLRIPPTAGSASGVLPNPIGYNRVYVPLAGEFTPEAWFESLRKGKTMMTNGPILFLDYAGGQASVDVVAREPIDRVEIIADGKVIHRVHARDGATSLKISHAIAAVDHAWIAARCFLATTETVRFAHTSPVYLDGEAPTRSADARYYIAWIDRLIADTTAERIPNSAQHDEVLKLYRKARAFYAARE